MTLRAVVADHYRQQKALSARMQRDARRMWRELDRADLTTSWLGIGDRLFMAVSSAQLLAAATANGYVETVLEEQGATSQPEGRVEPIAFAGIASDGRELEPLLYSPVTSTKKAITGGLPVSEAMSLGEEALATIVGTQVPDAGRGAVGAATIANHGASGWIRMLSGGGCSRCVVLAGKFYRTNSGFDRHPKCDCVHVPAAEASGVEDVRTDPAAYFRSLDPAEQDRRFTQAGARAIREGADIGQVVNARRGAQGLTTPGRLTADEQRMLRGGRARSGHLERVDVYGRSVFITSEGVTTRGLAGQRLGAAETGTKRGGRYRSSRTPRLMPEGIFELAGDNRDEAVRLLKRFGYIV